MGHVGTRRIRVVDAAEAVAGIRTGSAVAITGSGGGVNEPETVLAALEQRYLDSGEPAALTIYHPNGLGDAQGAGTDRFAHPGFVRRVYGSHWSWAPELTRMAAVGNFEIAVWPQGVLSQLLREMAAGRPGVVTHVGLGTYLDPRIQGKRPGCQVLPQLAELGGREWLFYPGITLDVALLRASVADEAGNLSMEREGTILDVLGAAQAVHNNGGLVIAQVKELVAAGTLDPRAVRVPGYLVDQLVVVPEQRQSFATDYNPGYSGEECTAVPPRPIERPERRLIARRAALELRPGMVINLGFGIADGVASIAAEEGVADRITFSIEQGEAGGIPAWDMDFGLMWNPTSIVDAPSQFDFYDGGGLDLAIVSFAQVDRAGNVNVSYFDGRLVGPGGFINITETAKRLVFCGTFATRGLRVGVDGERLIIEHEGALPKFVPEVDEITFSAARARERGQEVLYITERGVFRLVEEGIELVEIADGINVEDQILGRMGFRPRIAERLRRIPPVVYTPGLLGLFASEPAEGHA